MSVSSSDPGWAFINLADCGANSPRNYAATLLRVILLPLGFLILVFTAIALATATRVLPQSAMAMAILPATFAAIVVAGFALGRGVARSHRRPWMSLISPDLRLDWRRLAIGALTETILLLVVSWGAHALLGQPWPSGSRMSLPVLAIVMMLVPFQAASEEVLFRGYLTQAFGRVLRRRTAIALVVAGVFGALHLGAYGLLTMPYIFVLSLAFSIVSLRDERLELAIDAHAAMNWFGVAAVDPVDAAELEWTAFAILIAQSVLFYSITRMLVNFFCAPTADRDPTRPNCAVAPAGVARPGS